VTNDAALVFDPPAGTTMFYVGVISGTRAVNQIGINQFLKMMLDHFVDGRSGIGATDHPPLGFAPERGAMPPELALAYASLFKTPPAMPCRPASTGRRAADAARTGSKASGRRAASRRTSLLQGSSKAVDPASVRRQSPIFSLRLAM
jgi:hypothetical protein